MSAARDRTTAGGPKEARARLRTAEAYLRTAELVLEEAVAFPEVPVYYTCTVDE